MSTESRDSCEMRRCASEDEVFAGGPGSFFLDAPDERGVRELSCRLPNWTFIAISVAPQIPPGAARPIWTWDGDEDRPTLSPSVHTHGHWHGFFRAGRMESC